MSLNCGIVCGGGAERGTMLLTQLSASFQSLPILTTSKLVPSGADSQVSWFVFILGPSGYIQWTLLWGCKFLLLPQPSQVFSVRGFEALFPLTGVAQSVSLLSCFSRFFRTQMWDRQLSPCCMSSLWGCPSLPLLLVWINVSSLTPRLSDFHHTVQFSGSSGWLLFLNLLSFFWLCEEA